MMMQRYKLVVFDMDGVVFTHSNFWLELHRKLGTYKEGIALTKKYLFAYYERLVKEVVGRLWKGKDAAPYFSLIASSRYTPHAQAVLRKLKKKGLYTAIISSGPKHLALRVQEECGIDFFHTHDIIIGPDNRFTGEYVYDDIDNKDIKLKEFAERAGCTVQETVFVGHSHNDIAALRAAGLGVAYRPDADEVRAAADLVIDDLQALLEVLQA